MDGLYPGCAAPLSTVIVVSSPDIDLSDASAARLCICFPDDSVVEFEAELSGISETGCTVTRVHEATDIPTGSEGNARAWAEIDVDGADAPLRTSSHAFPILRRGQ